MVSSAASAVRHVWAADGNRGVIEKWNNINPSDTFVSASAAHEAN